MSESEHREEPDAQPTTPAQTPNDDARDDLVGRYTEVDGEGPDVRTVAGEYTRTQNSVDEDETVGDYVSSEKNPHTHDPAERPGKYTRADHGHQHDKHTDR